MINQKYWIFCFCIGMGIGTSVSSQESESAFLPALEDRHPTWLLLENSKKALLEMDLSESLRLSRLARKRHQKFPEADYLIGRVYAAEGNYALAVQQYERALQDSLYFYDREDCSDLYLSLAESYYYQDKEYLYEETLLKIVHTQFEAKEVGLRKDRQMLALLGEKTIDEVLFYYSYDDLLSDVLRALESLSFYYYSKSAYMDSIRYGLYVIVGTFSAWLRYLQEAEQLKRIPQSSEELYEIDPEYVIDKLHSDLKVVGLDYTFLWNAETLLLQDGQKQVDAVIEKIREVDPEYGLSSIGLYLDYFAKNEATNILLEEYKIYQLLYFIGVSLVFEGFSDSGFYIFRVLRYLPEAGKWQKRARLQLLEPFIERQLPLPLFH